MPSLTSANLLNLLIMISRRMCLHMSSNQHCNIREVMMPKHALSFQTPLPFESRCEPRIELRMHPEAAALPQLPYTKSLFIFINNDYIDPGQGRRP